MNKDKKKANLNVITILNRAVFLRLRDERKIEDQRHVSEVFLEKYYGRNACALACFVYNDFGLRSEPPLGSTFTREYSRTFLFRRFHQRVLHIYVDELGDVGPFNPKSPIYLISLVFVDQSLDRTKGLGQFKRIERRHGSGSFIHVGNLIRGEQPYAGFAWDRRRKLFFGLLTYAAGLDFRFARVRVEKCLMDGPRHLADSLRHSLERILDENMAFFIAYDKLIVHYDGGQKLCTKTLQQAFSTRFSHVQFEKTLQFDDTFMQIADLLCVLGNLEYKLNHGTLSHSEACILGNSRAVKKEVLGRFKRKRL